MYTFIASINTFTPFWLAWGVIFAVIEGIALKTRKYKKENPDQSKEISGGTLSELIWRFISHPAGRVAVAIFWIDLTCHFFFKTSLFPIL